MYQVARAILKDPEDHTYVSLIFGNLTADDILIKDLLDELASKHPDRQGHAIVRSCMTRSLYSQGAQAGCKLHDIRVKYYCRCLLPAIFSKPE